MYKYLLLFLCTTLSTCASATESDGDSGRGVHSKLYGAQSYGGAPTVTVKKGESPVFNVQYLALRGLAELPVLILEAAGVDYQATYYGKTDFAKNIKHTLPFGRLPVVSSAVLGGVVLAQSDSIVRFLADSTGLGGSTPSDKAKVDMWYETYKELFKQHSRWGKPFSVDALFSDAAPNSLEQKAILSFKESTNGGDYSDFEKSYLALHTFEASLVDKDSNEKVGMFVGGRAHMSYVDLALFTVLEDLSRHKATWGEDLGFPLLQDLYGRLAATLQDYLRSERRMPRVEVRLSPERDYWYVQEQINKKTEL